VILVVGPTGIGKTEVAVALARRIPASFSGKPVEIVVADSMQVYRGMDVGTGKPDASVRSGIPHHGLDLVEPEEEFHVARYVHEVAPAVEMIHRRGYEPLLVGGSGLYVKVLLDGICPAPGKEPNLRKQLWEQGRQVGAAVLHAELQVVDPKAAERIHPNDLRRIVRALEVFRLSGRPLSVWHSDTHSLLGEEREVQRIGLTCDRDRLYQRIEARIDGWLAAGWLEETRKLLARPLSLTAQEALGYRELFSYLRGEADWETTVSAIKQNTRRYAKRQWSWFRADPRIRWIAVDGLTPEAVAERIFKHIYMENQKGSDPFVPMRKSLLEGV